MYIGNHRDNKENRSVILLLLIFFTHLRTCSPAHAFYSLYSVIASLSLGAPRTFILTHDALQKRTTKTPNSPLHHRFQLENGSLVVMQGETQQKVNLGFYTR